jgi:hypothetical protein
MSEEIKKGLRPEVTREQMYAVIEHLQEAIEALIDDEVEEEDLSEAETEMESEDSSVSPIGDPEKNSVNWPVVKSENGEDYESDNEEEDKWDNIQKACWSGYKQVGMKEKNGRMVPNCVPVEKVQKSIWDGTFLK